MSVSVDADTVRAGTPGTSAKLTITVYRRRALRRQRQGAVAITARAKNIEPRQRRERPVAAAATTTTWGTAVGRAQRTC